MQSRTLSFIESHQNILLLYYEMRLALVYLMCPCLQPNQVGHVVTNASGFHQLACALVKQKGDLTIYTNVFYLGLAIHLFNL